MDVAGPRVRPDGTPKRSYVKKAKPAVVETVGAAPDTAEEKPKTRSHTTAGTTPPRPQDNHTAADLTFKLTR